MKRNTRRKIKKSPVETILVGAGCLIVAIITILFIYNFVTTIGGITSQTPTKTVVHADTHESSPNRLTPEIYVSPIPTTIQTTKPTKIPTTTPTTIPTTIPTLPPPPTQIPPPNITINIPSKIIYSVEPTPTINSQITSDKDYYKTKHETDPVLRNFNYIIDGKQKSCALVMYGGVNEYLNGKDRKIHSTNLKESYQKFIDDPIQDLYMEDYINYIKSTSKYSDEQVITAVRFVQNIPYDTNIKYPHYESRYPYQVLYDGKGVCSEKSMLLIYTLKKLGYGTAFMVFNDENHAVAGLKCEPIYAYKNTGYCFIESTTPIMITYSSLEYGYSGELTSQPNVYVMSDGRTFYGTKSEYDDAVRYLELQEKAEKNNWVLNSDDYNEWFNIAIKYGIKFVDNKKD